MNSRVCAALLLGAALATGCQPPTGQRPAAPTLAQGEAEAASARHETGRRIYNFRCYFCHGYSGDAQTLAARLVSPAPRDFRRADPASLRREAMIDAVRDGRAGTAMAAFGSTLTAAEIEIVVDFVRQEFMVRKAVNTRYHTAANGWPDHDRYAAAFPFANGEIPLDRPWDELSDSQAAGRRLYQSACISCHDRSAVTQLGEPWALRGVSYPPGNYEEDADGDHGDAAAHERDESDPYELHETPPLLADLTAQQKRGERLFQANCAHCHAADGTGRNWIGSFLQPPPPDFTAPPVAARLKRAAVTEITRNGRPATSMPAWKSVLAVHDIDAVAAYVERAWGLGAINASHGATRDGRRPRRRRADDTHRSGSRQPAHA